MQVFSCSPVVTGQSCFTSLSVLISAVQSRSTCPNTCLVRMGAHTPIGTSQVSQCETNSPFRVSFAARAAHASGAPCD